MAGLERGALFAALRMGDSELGRRWGAVIPECRRRFPELRPRVVADLHLTVAFLGPGWKEENLETIRATTRLDLSEDLPVAAEVVRLGHRQRVVAVELLGLPAELGAAVLRARAHLVVLGLKRSEGPDACFRPHVSLVELRGNPARAENRALEACADWVRSVLDPPSLDLRMGPGTPQSLLLAGVARFGAPSAYLEVEDFLRAASGR